MTSRLEIRVARFENFDLVNTNLQFLHIISRSRLVCSNLIPERRRRRTDILYIPTAGASVHQGAGWGPLPPPAGGKSIHWTLSSTRKKVRPAGGS